MKRKIQFRRDADVLVATSKQVGQFDQPIINPAIKSNFQLYLLVSVIFSIRT